MRGTAAQAQNMLADAAVKNAADSAPTDAVLADVSLAANSLLSAQCLSPRTASWQAVQSGTAGRAPDRHCCTWSPFLCKVWLCKQAKTLSNPTHCTELCIYSIKSLASLNTFTTFSSVV